MTDQELRSLIRQAASKAVQSWDLKSALEHGGCLSAQQVRSYTGYNAGQDKRLDALVGVFIWGLVRDGLAEPYQGSHSDIDSRFLLNNVMLTPYGVQALSNTQATAHEPLGLLKAFDELVGPDLPEQVRSVFESALFNFQHPQTYVGCAILLGVASEELIDELIRTTRMSEGNIKLFERRAGHQKASAYDRATAIQEIWRDGLEIFLRQTPKGDPENLVLEDLRDAVTVHLTSVALLIRKGRNKGGHPNRLGTLMQAELFASLNMFPLYCREIKKLIDWIKQSPDRKL
jgi:hypothetical protein